MASEDRHASRRLALFAALSEAPYQFDFYQALRRIESAFPDKPRIGDSRRPQDDPVRFGQEASLAFAPSTLTAFELGNEGRPPRLLESFFGMWGPNGPLPLHLTEFARDRERNSNDPTLVRFLDVFHHRLISLFYRAWARAQPTVNRDRAKGDRFTLYMGALAGYAGASLRERDSVPEAAKLSFSGLLGRNVKNAEGLAAVLCEFFRVPVSIESFIAHWMWLPEDLYSRLGRSESSSLGSSLVLGPRVWDLQSKFRVIIGPLTLAQYERFLPGAMSYQRLTDWIRNYTGLELKWDCHLVLQRDEVPSLRLGMAGKLGWTSWLGTRSEARDADDLQLAGQ